MRWLITDTSHSLTHFLLFFCFFHSPIACAPSLIRCSLRPVRCFLLFTIGWPIAFDILLQTRLYISYFRNYSVRLYSYTLFESKYLLLLLVTNRISYPFIYHIRIKCFMVIFLLFFYFIYLQSFYIQIIHLFRQPSRQSKHRCGSAIASEWNGCHEARARTGIDMVRSAHRQCNNILLKP